MTERKLRKLIREVLKEQSNYFSLSPRTDVEHVPESQSLRIFSGRHSTSITYVEAKKLFKFLKSKRIV